MHVCRFFLLPFLFFFPSSFFVESLGSVFFLPWDQLGDDEGFFFLGGGGFTR